MLTLHSSTQRSCLPRESLWHTSNYILHYWECTTEDNLFLGRRSHVLMDTWISNWSGHYNIDHRIIGDLLWVRSCSDGCCLMHHQEQDETNVQHEDVNHDKSDGLFDWKSSKQTCQSISQQPPPELPPGDTQLQLEAWMCNVWTPSTQNHIRLSFTISFGVWSWVRHALDRQHHKLFRESPIRNVHFNGCRMLGRIRE